MDAEILSCAVTDVAEEVLSRASWTEKQDCMTDETLETMEKHRSVRARSASWTRRCDECAAKRMKTSTINNAQNSRAARTEKSTVNIQRSVASRDNVRVLQLVALRQKMEELSQSRKTCCSNKWNTRVSCLQTAMVTVSRGGNAMMKDAIKKPLNSGAKSRATGPDGIVVEML